MRKFFEQFLDLWLKPFTKCRRRYTPPISHSNTLIAALSEVSSALQGCRSYTPLPATATRPAPNFPVTLLPGPPIALILALGDGVGVALPPARGAVLAGWTSDNPVAVQGGEATLASVALHFDTKRGPSLGL